MQPSISMVWSPPLQIPLNSNRKFKKSYHLITIVDPKTCSGVDFWRIRVLLLIIPWSSPIRFIQRNDHQKIPILYFLLYWVPLQATSQLTSIFSCRKTTRGLHDYKSPSLFCSAWTLGVQFLISRLFCELRCSILLRDCLPLGLVFRVWQSKKTRIIELVWVSWFVDDLRMVFVF